MKNSKIPYEKRGKKAGIISGISIFVLGFLIFRSLNPIFLIVLLAISIGLGAIIRIMAQGLNLENTPTSTATVSNNIKTNTGDKYADSLLNQGKQFVQQIKYEKNHISDKVLLENLELLEEKCTQIYKVIYEQPEKANKIEKFMNYYLPTTIKMVQGYRDLTEKNINSKEVIDTKNRIKETIQAVAKSCDTLMEKLYRNDVLDLTTDIDVIEQMLKRDGLTENDLIKAKQQAINAIEIDHAVNEKETVASVPTMDGGIYTIDNEKVNVSSSQTN